MACRAGPRGTHHREATLPGDAVAQEGERRRGGKNGGGIAGIGDNLRQGRIHSFPVEISMTSVLS
ncbi:MAG: hypothetical protein ACPIOQ_23020, partial [Promethearchaeia archaeon]